MESWSVEDGLVLSDSYGKEASNKYDLYLPKNIDLKADAPLLLLIHGRSWTGGKRDEVAYDSKYYAKNGCITTTMAYSLFSDKNDVTIKTLLDEITACTTVLKQRLAKEGCQVPKIAVGGFSAGGHLALLYAIPAPRNPPSRSRSCSTKSARCRSTGNSGATGSPRC